VKTPSSWLFLKKHAATLGKEIHGFTPEAVTAIQTHGWPWNIRELVNRISRAVVMANGVTITPDKLGLKFNTLKPEPLINGFGLKETKAKFEAEFLAAAPNRYWGNVQLAARALKTSRSVVYHLMQKYEIRQTSLPRSTAKIAHPGSAIAA
jgi:two-component system NtrC family response regulator